MIIALTGGAKKSPSDLYIGSVGTRLKGPVHRLSMNKT